MIDPTFMIPDSLKERFVDWLVESVAGQAEKVGSDQAAHVIRKLSSDAVFRASADQALQTGIERFIEEYREQDEDLVDAIVQDATFWQSAQVQQALKDIVEHPGASMPDQAKVIAGHFDTVLPQRVNRKRVGAAVSYLLGCIAQGLWSLPGAREVREIYGLQFQKMTAEESREQTTLMRQQLEATLEFTAEMRQAFLQLAGAMEKTLLAPPSTPTLAASPRPYNNLPQPTYVRFVGRDAELAWLRERLSPVDRAWQIAINGIGGVGKTALALAVADEYRRHYHELSTDERFEAIVWVSAKEEVLTAQGRERADLPEAILHTLEDVYTAIARVLEREDITRSLPEEQDALVRKALQRQRTLLVMDNMESVEDDRIKAFLRKLPAPTKAVITSRDWIDVADVRVLRGLSPEDAEALIREEATTREVALNVKQRERLYDLTAGLPLPLKLGIARMSAGESFAAVERWLGDATGDLPEYCVKGQVDLVLERDSAAWTLLVVCALFDQGAGASFAALRDIARLSIADHDRALAVLQKLFLINRTEDDRFWLLPITQRYINATSGVTNWNWETVENWLKWMTETVRTYHANLEKSKALLPVVGVEYPNVLLAVRWCRSHQRWPELIELALGTAFYTYTVGLFADLEELLDAASEANKSVTDPGVEGWIELWRGRLAWIRGRSGIAWRHFENVIKCARETDNRTLLSTAHIRQALILRHGGQFDEAASLTSQALEESSIAGDTRLRISAADNMAAIESERGNHASASQWLDRAEDWAREASDKDRIVELSYRKGRILMEEDRFAEAEPFLVQSLEYNKMQGRHMRIARDMVRLAEVHAHIGRFQLATDCAQEAKIIAERIGLPAQQAQAERLLKELNQDYHNQNNGLE